MNFSNKQYRKAVKKASKMSKEQLERIAVNGKSIKDMTPEERKIVINKFAKKGDFGKVRKEVEKIEKID